MGIAALWILWIRDRAIPLALAFSEDPEIVAVEMHGVREVGVIADDDADGGVFAEIVDVPLGIFRIGSVSELGEKEERVAIGAMVFFSYRCIFLHRGNGSR